MVMMMFFTVVIMLIVGMVTSVTVLEGTVGSRYVKNILSQGTGCGGGAQGGCAVDYVDNVNLKEWQQDFTAHSQLPMRSLTHHRKSFFL